MGHLLRPPPPLGTILSTVMVLVTPALAGAQVRPPEEPLLDAFGYAAYSQVSPECGASFLDISGTGTPLSFTAAGADPALDEGGVVIDLVLPFELYGVPTNRLVLSSNGYLAAADSLALEGGGDFSNDCPLPGVPEHAPASPLRIALLHDDLDGSSVSGPGGDGVAHTEFFPSCPRLSEAWGDEPCTVLQLSSWHVRGSTALFALQAVLYHTSFEIALQYDGADYVARSQAVDHHGATVGIQNLDASIGLAPACNLRGLTMTGAAFCLFDHRFPAGGPAADLEADIVSFPPSANAGELVAYTIEFANSGPTPTAGVTVSVPQPAELESCAWTCSGTDGGACSPAGAGGILETIDLPPDGWVAYDLSCTVRLDTPASSTVTTTATIVGPGAIPDPDPDDNSSSVETHIPIPVTLQLFTID